MKLRSKKELESKGFLSISAAVRGLRQLAQEAEDSSDPRTMLKWSITLSRSMPLENDVEIKPTEGQFYVSTISYHSGKGD